MSVIVSIEGISGVIGLSIERRYNSAVRSGDFLTGQPNRALLTDRLVQAIALAQRHRKRVALMYLDLDKFKDIHDSLGHSVGNQLLQSAATAATTSKRLSVTPTPRCITPREVDGMTTRGLPRAINARLATRQIL
jgi:hypothetical protein